MDTFRTIARHWPNGVELDLGSDSQVLGGPSTFDRTAPDFVTSSDGTQTYQFLFWNTGRHVTNKRKVKWIFSVLGWGVWTATRWYGVPGGGGGPARVRADALSIGGDTTLSGTPIDGAASTYAAGAWPFNGDDHAIGTATGPATVVAEDPLSGYDFAGWLQLFYGGDPTGEFVETDVGTGGVIGGPGFFDHVTGVNFSAAQGTSADLLAAYGYKPSAGPSIGRIWPEIFRARRPVLDIPKPGDPGPEDWIRLKILADLLRETTPVQPGGADFQQLVEAAPSMSREQLQRSIQSVKTTLDLGKSALSSLEAHLRKSGK